MAHSIDSLHDSDVNSSRQSNSRRSSQVERDEDDPDQGDVEVAGQPTEEEGPHEFELRHELDEDVDQALSEDEPAAAEDAHASASEHESADAISSPQAQARSHFGRVTVEDGPLHSRNSSIATRPPPSPPMAHSPPVAVAPPQAILPSPTPPQVSTIPSIIETGLAAVDASLSRSRRSGEDSMTLASPDSSRLMSPQAMNSPPSTRSDQGQRGLPQYGSPHAHDFASSQTYAETLAYGSAGRNRSSGDKLSLKSASRRATAGDDDDDFELTACDTPSHQPGMHTSFVGHRGGPRRYETNASLALSDDEFTQMSPPPAHAHTREPLGLIQGSLAASGNLTRSWQQVALADDASHELEDTPDSSLVPSYSFAPTYTSSSSSSVARSRVITSNLSTAVSPSIAERLVQLLIAKEEEIYAQAAHMRALALHNSQRNHEMIDLIHTIERNKADYNRMLADIASLNARGSDRAPHSPMRRQPFMVTDPTKPMTQQQFEVYTQSLPSPDQALVVVRPTDEHPESAPMSPNSQPSISHQASRSPSQPTSPSRLASLRPADDSPPDVARTTVRPRFDARGTPIPILKVPQPASRSPELSAHSSGRQKGEAASDDSSASTPSPLDQAGRVDSESYAPSRIHSAREVDGRSSHTGSSTFQTPASVPALQIPVVSLPVSAPATSRDGAPQELSASQRTRQSTAAAAATRMSESAQRIWDDARAEDMSESDEEEERLAEEGRSADASDASDVERQDTAPTHSSARPSDAEPPLNSSITDMFIHDHHQRTRSDEQREREATQRKSTAGAPPIQGLAAFVQKEWDKWRDEEQSSSSSRESTPVRRERSPPRVQRIDDSLAASPTAGAFKQSRSNKSAPPLSPTEPPKWPGRPSSQPTEVTQQPAERDIPVRGAADKLESSSTRIRTKSHITKTSTTIVHPAESPSSSASSSSSSASSPPNFVRMDAPTVHSQPEPEVALMETPYTHVLAELKAKAAKFPQQIRQQYQQLQQQQRREQQQQQPPSGSLGSVSASASPAPSQARSLAPSDSPDRRSDRAEREDDVPVMSSRASVSSSTGAAAGSLRSGVAPSVGASSVSAPSSGGASSGQSESKVQQMFALLQQAQSEAAHYKDLVIRLKKDRVKLKGKVEKLKARLEAQAQSKAQLPPSSPAARASMPTTETSTPVQQQQQQHQQQQVPPPQPPQQQQQQQHVPHEVLSQLIHDMDKMRRKLKREASHRKELEAEVHRLSVTRHVAPPMPAAMPSPAPAFPPSQPAASPSREYEAEQQQITKSPRLQRPRGQWVSQSPPRAVIVYADEIAQQYSAQGASRGRPRPRSVSPLLHVLPNDDVWAESTSGVSGPRRVSPEYLASLSPAHASSHMHEESFRVQEEGARRPSRARSNKPPAEQKAAAHRARSAHAPRMDAPLNAAMLKQQEEVEKEQQAAYEQYKRREQERQRLLEEKRERIRSESREAPVRAGRPTGHPSSRLLPSFIFDEEKESKSYAHPAASTRSDSDEEGFNRASSSHDLPRSRWPESDGLTHEIQWQTQRAEHARRDAAEREQHGGRSRPPQRELALSPTRGSHRFIREVRREEERQRLYGNRFGEDA